MDQRRRHEHEALEPRHVGVEDCESPPPEDASGWIGVGWFAAICLVSATLVALALPPVDDPAALSDVVHFQWLVLGTLLVWPLNWCARRRAWCGLAALAVMVAQSFSVVATGLSRAAHDEVLPSAGVIWYGVWLLQVLLFAGFTATGVRARLRDRRWERLVRSLTQPVRVRRQGWRHRLTRDARSGH